MNDPLEELEELTLKLNNITMNPTSSSRNSGLNDSQREEIVRIVSGLLSGQNSVSDEGSDVPIGTVSPRLEELDKVPDLVKSIREFSGKPGEFSSWRKSVDRVLDLYSSLKGTGRHYAILHTIRTKIVGEADTALESYRTPLDWQRIRKCLMVHYSDKRDIGTLEYQMNVLCQGHKSVTEFYQQVYQTLSLILDKVSCLDLEEKSLRAMTDTYREKALDTFIRGLNGDLPKLLSVKEPTSLPQALHLCLKLDNMSFRREYAHKGAMKLDARQSLNTGMKFYPELATIPSNRSRNLPTIQYRYPSGVNNPQFQRPHFGGPQHSQFAPRPQGVQQFFHKNNFGGQTPNYSNQRPEPMDVDRSTQMRPQQKQIQPYKRPAQFSIQAPVNKVQRNFHVNVGYPENDSLIDSDNTDLPYETRTESCDEYFMQCPDNVTTEDYQDQGTDDVPANFIDIHFLD